MGQIPAERYIDLLYQEKLKLVIFVFSPHGHSLRVFLSLCPKTSSVMLLTHGKSEQVMRQNEQLMNGVPILISTPAALNSKLKQGILRLVEKLVPYYVLHGGIQSNNSF